MTVEVPAEGDLPQRCSDYLTKERLPADVCIPCGFDPKRYPELDYNGNVYMQSCARFYGRLTLFDGLMLHASGVALEDRAYLFSGPCGRGKSTHTKLWQEAYPGNAVVFNDDKPGIRYLDGKWFAYGTPWCGKDGINVNMRTPLAGICFLKQDDHNEIRRLGAREALERLLPQTTYRLNTQQMNGLLQTVDRLLRDIPVFELCNRPEPDAARLSHDFMLRTAKETGL